jgi:hypothetical protein
MGSWRPEVGEGSSLSVNCPRAVWLFVHLKEIRGIQGQWRQCAATPPTTATNKPNAMNTPPMNWWNQDGYRKRPSTPGYRA